MRVFIPYACVIVKGILFFFYKAMCGPFILRISQLFCKVLGDYKRLASLILNRPLRDQNV